MANSTGEFESTPKTPSGALPDAIASIKALTEPACSCPEGYIFIFINIRVSGVNS